MSKLTTTAKSEKIRHQGGPVILVEEVGGILVPFFSTFTLHLSAIPGRPFNHLGSSHPIWLIRVVKANFLKYKSLVVWINIVVSFLCCQIKTQIYFKPVLNLFNSKSMIMSCALNWQLKDHREYVDN